MKKLIFYLSNNNQCFRAKEPEFKRKLNEKKPHKRGVIYKDFYLDFDPKYNFEENISHYGEWYRILEANSETPAIIHFPEYCTSVSHQLSFADILCSLVLPDRKAPIYIFTHSETIVKKAMSKTDLSELDIIWLYEVGGVQKQYIFTEADIKDALNDGFPIWLNMHRYLPKEDLPNFD